MDLNKYYLYFFSIFLLSFQGVQALTVDDLPFKFNEKSKIKRNKIIVSSHVSSYEKENKKFQRMNFKTAGLHKKSCAHSIPRMFNYESYQEKIGMINISRYNDTLKRIHIEFQAPVIKKKFTLNFKIPRIRKPGSYEFYFDRGFLKDLKGTIVVTPYKRQCLYFLKAKWEGPHSGYPDFILSLFSKTAMDLAGNKLFRISGSY